MDLTRARGRLFIIGGGENREGACSILSEFVRLAGDEKARIVVLTTATNIPEKYIDVYARVFKNLKVAKVDFIDVSQRQDAMDEGGIRLVKKATGIFFTGGNQLHITTLMGGTSLQAAIFEAYENNVIIAGTSAGAAMMGSAMIVRGSSELNPRMGSVEIATGSGLISGCVIDTHFSQRGRHGRLLTAVAHFPQHIGFGIDENTAMLVDKDRIEVFGEGAVTVFDAAGMTYSDIPYAEQGQSIALANVVINVLPSTYRFDLKTRKMIVTKASPQGPKRARKNLKAPCAVPASNGES